MENKKKTTAAKRQRVLKRAHRRYRELQYQKDLTPAERGPYHTARRLLPTVRALTMILGALFVVMVLVDRISIASKLGGDPAFKLVLWMVVELAVILLVTGLLYLFLWGVQGILDTSERGRDLVEESRTSGERLTEIAEASVDSEDE